jgi:peptidoglycan/xylan/chitin deacetylase (PgdA/CDA1 family)
MPDRADIAELGHQRPEPPQAVVTSSTPSAMANAPGIRSQLAKPVMNIEPARSVVDRVRSLLAAQIPIKPHRVRIEAPIVTFCFDDFPRSAGKVGAEIVERYGGHATYFVCAGLLGTRDAECEYPNLDDLVELVARGHELGCHSFSHVDVLRIRRQELLEELQHNGRAIANALAGYRLENFAYPFGRVSLGAKLAAATRFATARGTEPGINRGIVDLAQLRCNFLYAPESNFETARRLIGSNARSRGWLIFLTHDVQDQPTRYGCTPAQLEEIVSTAAQSGAQILSIVEALASTGVGGSGKTDLTSSDLPG